MKIFKSRVVKALTLVIVLVCITLVGGRYLLFYLIEKKIKDAIRIAKKDGTIITYDSLYTNAWTGSLSLKGLVANVSNSNKSAIGPAAVTNIKSIQITGIEILPLIFHRRIVVQSLLMDRPDVHVPEDFRFNSTKSKNKTKLSGVLIRHLNITSASFEALDSVSLKTSKRVRFSRLQAMDVIVSGLTEHTVNWKVGSSNLDTIVVNLTKAMYTISLKRLGYNANDKNITIDSIHIIPDHDKHLFAKLAKRQIDRIEATIPLIEARGCEINKISNSSFTSSHVSLAFDIEVFRDKRYPFHNNPKSLPERFLHSLSINLQVDTLSVKDSHVLYEEFPEKGDSAGRVFFNKLNASLYNLSNISTEDAKMDAEANLMDAGKLRVSFTFPANPDKAYMASGTLINFDLQSINPMLEPLANAKIQSGKMEEMKFNFEYNDYRSDGKVVLNYTDLKMESRKKSNLGDKIVTLLLNTFIRNTMDKHTDTAKKTGTILFYRDQHRAIFNYWWKSLLSGIKSVYNLDKITNTSSNKKSN